MKVLLVGPELEENLTLRYLSGALVAAGHEAVIVRFDGPGDQAEVADEICATSADMAAFSMVYTRRAKEFAELITRCRSQGFSGLTIAGGSFAAFHPEALLRDVPALDAVGVGEGERLLCDLAREPGAPEEVAGLVWRDGEQICKNPPAPLEEDLDSYPWPTRRRPFDSYHGLPIVNMLGSRGCTYHCGFCSIAAWHRMCGGSRHRMRRPEAIAAEMACLYREGVRLYNFHDDNFLGPQRESNLRRVLALHEALAAQGVGKIAFQIKARPDAVDPELFALLREMGLFRVFLGVEAGTEASLRSLGRRQTLPQNVRALEILNDLDLHVAFNLLVLNPDSTLEDFAGNVAFLREHARNPLNFCRTEIYTGTPLARRLREEARLTGSYWGLDYAIADTRVQRAFEIFRVAFFERNFGGHPLHYLSNQVDYEHQLRADFFGTSATLRAAAKRFIREVNENTAAHLEAIIAAVQSGQATEAFAEAVACRVAADDQRLHAKGQQILERIQDLSDLQHQQARPPRRRSSAGVAATLALALAGCPGRTAPMEAAPPPPPPVDAPAAARDAGSGQTPADAAADKTRGPRSGVIRRKTQPAEAAPPPPTPQPNEAAPAPPQTKKPAPNPSK
jgi:radical SAM superfamily enzyme YgiQ (UPF0313 family)